MKYEEALKRLSKLKESGIKLFPSLSNDEKRKVLFIKDEPDIPVQKKKN